MKKVVKFILIISLVFVLFGCKKKNKTTTKTVETFEPVTMAPISTETTEPTTSKINTTTDPAKTYYTVTFDMNGGTSKAIEEQLIESNCYALKPNTPNRITSSIEYTFSGWYVSNTEDEANKWDFDTNKVTKNITLVAKWVPGIHYSDPV